MATTTATEQVDEEKLKRILREAIHGFRDIDDEFIAKLIELSKKTVKVENASKVLEEMRK